MKPHAAHASNLKRLLPTSCWRSCDALPRLRRQACASWRALAGLGLMLAGLMIFSSSGSAQSKGVNEYDLKAAFVSKFPLFIKWPEAPAPAPNAPLVIGVLGKSPIGAALESVLQGKVIAGRPLAFEACGSVEEAERCQIVFISESEKGALPNILERLKTHNVLTVSDLTGFAEAGGMLGLSEVSRKVRLEVNLQATQAAGLRVDPQLLQLAKVVHPAAAEAAQ